MLKFANQTIKEILGTLPSLFFSEAETVCVNTECVVCFAHLFSVGRVKGEPHLKLVAGAVGIGRGNSLMKFYHIS